MELTHGMKVTCEIEGKEITDAKISKDADGSFFICQDKKRGTGAENKLGYKYSWEIGNVESADDLNDSAVTNLKIIGKTKDISDIKSYEVGDILVDKNGDRRKVLGICDLIIMLSWSSDFERASPLLYTTQELVEEYRFLEELEDTLIGKELTQTIKGKKYKVVVKEEIDG